MAQTGQRSQWHLGALPPEQVPASATEQVLEAKARDGQWYNWTQWYEYYGEHAKELWDTEVTDGNFRWTTKNSTDQMQLHSATQQARTATVTENSATLADQAPGDDDYMQFWIIPADEVGQYIEEHKNDDDLPGVELPLPPDYFDEERLLDLTEGLLNGLSIHSITWHNGFVLLKQQGVDVYDLARRGKEKIAAAARTKGIGKGHGLDYEFNRHQQEPRDTTG